MEQQESLLEDIKADEVEASYTQRLFTNIMDWIIEIVLIVGFYFFSPRKFIAQLFEINYLMKYIIAFSILFGYRLISILLTGKTIGMNISRVKYLNGDLLPLTTKEKLVAVFTTRTKEIKYYKL